MDRADGLTISTYIHIVYPHVYIECRTNRQNQQDAWSPHREARPQHFRWRVW